MNLLLYSSEADADEHQLLAHIKNTEGIEIYRSAEALWARLVKPAQIAKIFILIADRETLSRFSEWGDLLNDRQLILILTDDSAETIRIAHSFRPRYVSIKGGNFEDVGNVLERMILRMEAQDKHLKKWRRLP
jgi:hypothetical protein